MKIKLTESDLKHIVKESVFKILNESIYDDGDGFYSNTSVDDYSNNIENDDEEYDEDRERELSVAHMLCEIDELYSNESFGIELVDEDENGKEYYPYKPYAIIYCVGAHVEHIKDVRARIINGKVFKDITWKNMSEDMKEDIEDIVSMIYHNKERG